ncbi:MAG: hypothetical protein JJU36_04770, partial [Phycisphaeraceae bacterium]|nr:hypothetical protein [Phycisphaeraceae bacterium]
DYLTLDNALPVEFTDPSLLYTVVLPGGATMAVAMIDPVSELVSPELVDPRSPTAMAVEVVATLMATRLQLPDAPRVARSRFGKTLHRERTDLESSSPIGGSDGGRSITGPASGPTAIHRAGTPGRYPQPR